MRAQPEAETVINNNFDENDIQSVIQSWMKSRTHSSNTTLIQFSNVDQELKLPPGSARKYIERVANECGYVVERKGSETILFKIKKLEQPKRNDFLDKY